jgi:hypothetical protein
MRCVSLKGILEPQALLLPLLCFLDHYELSSPPPGALHHVLPGHRHKGNRTKRPWTEISETMSQINLSSFQIVYLGGCVT